MPSEGDSIPRASRDDPDDEGRRRQRSREIAIQLESHQMDALLTGRRSVASSHDEIPERVV